jgi:hypothetical protein
MAAIDRKARVLLAFGVAAIAGIGWILFAPMRHVLHLHNTSATASFTVGVALDNQPDVYFERHLPANATDTLEFQRSSEAGYVFYDVHGSSRFELGRCGYTDRHVNEYRIDLAPSSPFDCAELSANLAA